MSNYPTLTEMGIQRFDEIDHYSLLPDGKNRDIIRIYYKRDKNSLLPRRKTFRFGRSLKVQHTVGDPNDTQEVYEISPFVQKACQELDQLLAGKNNKKDQAKLLIARIDELGAEMHVLTTELKDLIKAM